jgi:hypothetical protein
MAGRGWLVALALAIGGCGASKKAVVATEETVTIGSNTQRSFGAVSVGAGNIWEEDARRGLSAGLWFSSGDRPAQGRHLRVRRGQVVREAGIALRIVDVTADGVTVAVVKPD